MNHHQQTTDFPSTFTSISSGFPKCTDIPTTSIAAVRPMQLGRSRSSSEVVRYANGPVVPHQSKRSFSFSLPSPTQQDRTIQHRTPSPTFPEDANASTRRRQYVCRFENCRNPRPNKKSNIEKHVWTQHIRHKFKGLDQVSYQAKLYKHHVERYVVPISPSSSVSSSSSSTPLTSPSAAKQLGAPMKVLSISGGNKGNAKLTKTVKPLVVGNAKKRRGRPAVQPRASAKENRIEHLDAAKVLLKLSLFTTTPRNCLSPMKNTNVNITMESRQVETN